MSSRALFRVISTALCSVALASCSGGEEGKDGGSGACLVRDGGRDCSQLCDSYCAKLLQCGVTSGGSSCEEDCRTITEAGASTESYQCVITKECSEISNCGI